MGNPHKPTLKVSLNPKTQQLTYRVGKAGFHNHFLLYGQDEIRELFRLMDEAGVGRHENAS